ncbi:hypothetical protein ACFYVL_29200 [Streptomyces sp. NPDC004111]|uniref:hypothetical protein n=1 Tax=Streptomyces sp. NPDC004111 TaxID=3364690 RepID=UPI0036893ED7
MPRPPLPPPPPPAEIQAWPDRGALLADRARAMRELGRRALGVPAAVGFWLYALLLVIGWGCVGVALQSFAEGMFPEVLVGVVFLVLGIGAIVPAAILLGLGVRRDRVIRERLRAWGELGPDPAVDAELRAPVRSLAWLLPSFVLAALGLWTSLGWSARALPGEDTYAEAAYFIGMGCVLWLVGLLGVLKAVRHYRWALRSAHTPTGAES